MASDGGPAFPIHSRTYAHEAGMSLRDYFAGQALLGCLINETVSKGAYMKAEMDKCLIGSLYGEMAYQIVDAMLAARSAKDKDA